MSANVSNVQEFLRQFEPTKNKLDHRLFEYGPLLVLLQLNVTGLALILSVLYVGILPNPQMITWAVFSPIYAGVLFTLFVESIAIRHFLKTIPVTFQQLWVGGILKGMNTTQVSEQFQTFLESFEKRLNSKERLAFGLTISSLGLIFFWITGHISFTLESWINGSGFSTAIVRTIVNLAALFLPAAVVGYGIGIGTWKCIVTGLYVRRFSKIFELDIQSNHPDNAGGLKPLGSLIFGMATILIIASLTLSGATILSRSVGFINTEQFSKVFLGLVFGLSLIAFFFPLFSTHERMVNEKEKSKQLLIEISQRIAKLERSVQTELDKMDYKQRQDVWAEIDSLSDLYKRVTQIPTWPFNREIFLKFAAPQAVSLLSLTGLANPIVDGIRSLAIVLTSKP